MRWMRELTLGGVALLAGCLEPRSVHCDDGVVCPDGTTCASEPVFCAAPDRVAACQGKNIPELDRCELVVTNAITKIDETIVGACRGGACFECADNELAGCEHHGWFPMVSNTTTELRGVWAAGPTEAYAVGGDTIVRYDGFDWEAKIIPNADFTAVWGSDPDNVFATSANGAIYQRTEGGSWAVVHDEGLSLKSIGGSGPGDVIALDLRGSIVRFDGAGWSVEPIPTTELLFGLSARSRDDVFVVGTRGAIHRSAGIAWPMSRTAMAGQATLRAVATTPTAVFAIGDGNVMTTSALRLPAGQSTWIETVIPGVPSTFFDGIWASVEEEAFAVGAGGRIIHYTGTWSVLDTDTGGANLHAIHGSDRRDVFAVGANGTILRYTGP